MLSLLQYGEQDMLIQGSVEIRFIFLRNNEDDVVKVLRENKSSDIIDTIVDRFPHILEYYFKHNLVDILKSNVVASKCNLRWNPYLKKLNMNELKLHILYQMDLPVELLEVIEFHLYI